jgi:hypothetical protein
MSGSPGLSFAVESAAAVPFAATPLVALTLRITATRPVQSIVLRSQVQLEVARRNYTPAEQAQLEELFGEPARWSDTLRPLLWTHTSALVPAFESVVDIELLLPCSFDFTLAATKYFHGVLTGEVPLLLLFSGTVFHGSAGGLSVAPIPWSKEARFRMPVRVLSELREQYYPSSASLLLHRDIFDRLRRFKIDQGHATWEQTLAYLLDSARPAKGDAS